MKNAEEFPHLVRLWLLWYDMQYMVIRWLLVCEVPDGLGSYHVKLNESDTERHISCFCSSVDSRLRNICLWLERWLEG